MAKQINNKLITFIEANLTKERLEAVSSSIINAYKSGDSITVKSCAEALNLNSDGSIKQTFYSLIQRIHPDRLSIIKTEFLQAKASCDESALEKIKQLLEVRVNAEAVRASRFEYQHTETWASADDDGYYEDHDADAEVFEDSSYEGSFFEAVKEEIFGNHDFHIEPADLGQIDGGLDIAFCGLDDIDGIEYCRNLSILDITGNDISNIYNLQELSQLEELYASGNSIRDIEILGGLEHLEILDLSDNDIEDISPLLNMSNLKFADLRSNPIHNRELIEQLEADGIVVFC